MFRLLFSMYSKAPRPLRRIIVAFSAVPRFMARLFVRQIHVGGYVMKLDFSDNASFRYLFYRDAYEPLLMSNLLRVVSLNPSSCFLDIGAGYGAYSLAIASMGKYGLVKKIYAFEPDSRPYEALRSSVEANQYGAIIELNNVLVGDFEGEADLLQSVRASTSNRSFASSRASLTFMRTLKRRCVTIDSLVGSQSPLEELRAVIKIDVEGNELRVLRGMNRLLRSCRGFLMQFEYFPLGMREVGVEPAEIRALLSELALDFFAAEFDEKLFSFARLQELNDFLQRLGDESGEHVVANVIVGRDLNYPQIPRHNP